MTKPRSVAATANDNSIPGSKLENGSITDVKISDTAQISSDKLYFLQSGVGTSNGRSVQGKLRDIISVKDFGAVGDGTTDDWSSFVAAIDHIKSKALAGEPTPALFIPSGTYRVTRGFQIEVPMDIYGEGPESSVVLTEWQFTLFNINLDLSGSEGAKVRFRDMKISGTYANLPQQNGISVTSGVGQKWVDLENCQVEYLGGHGIITSTTVSVRVHRSNIYWCKRDGIRIEDGETTDTRITESIIRYNRAGIVIGSGANVYSLWISGCLIETNVKGAGAIGPDSRPSAGIMNFGFLQIAWIKNCYFEGQLYPILNKGPIFQKVQVDGCYFNHNLVADHNSSTTDVPYTPRPVTYVTAGQTVSITNCSAGNYISKPGYLTDAQWHTYDVVQTLTGEGSSGSTTFIVSSIANLYPGALISITGLSGYYTVGSVRWAPSGAGPFEISLTSPLASTVPAGTVVTLHKGTTHPCWQNSGFGYAENNYGKGSTGTYENPYYLPTNGGIVSSLSNSRDPGVSNGYYDVQLPERAIIRANNFYSVLCRAGIFSSNRSSASGLFTGIYSSQFSETGNSCASVLSSFNSISNHDSTLVLSSQGVASASSFKVTGGFGGSPTSGPRSTANRTWEIDSVTGNVTIAGAVTPGATFSDFAEYFENESVGVIGLGTIVTLVGHRVREALPGDEILGVVSATAAVAAGDTALGWAGKYLTGEFGEPLYDAVPLESWKPGEGETEEDRPTVKVRRLNPDYDPTVENVPRSERPEEWTCVGLIGQVFVRVNEGVSPGDYVTETGDRASEKTKLRCMEITSQFSVETRYAVAKCLLV